jgi:hypothetical protein
VSDHEAVLLQMEGFGKYQWEGFPPPEILWACQGAMTGFRAVIDPEEAPAEALEELSTSPSIETTVYRKVRQSPEGAEGQRSAEYEAVPHDR